MSKTNKIITPVVFRKYTGQDFNEIIALFPYEIELSDGCCSSYQHIGQHGAANYSGVIASTKAATEIEYADLKKELENLSPEPYYLKVITRRSYPKYLKAFNEHWKRRK